jgi:2'-5' RNA ligase
VAVELDEACRRALQSAVEKLQGVARGVHWVRAEGMHLTLVFIGALDAADLPRTIAVLQSAAASAGPFLMAVSGLSGFPPRGVPRVIHVGVQEPTGVLEALQKAVESGLVQELGIRQESRRFVSHVTVGRARDRRDCPPMEAISAAVENQDFGQVWVDSMVLMSSELRPGGALYTPLHRFALGG